FALFIEQVLPDLNSAQYLPASKRQQLQQSVLQGRQFKGVSGPVDGPGDRVDFQVIDADHGALDAVAAPNQGAQPRQQLVHLERLDQVIVGAPIQALDSVFDVAACGQDQDRRIHALFSPCLQQL